MTPIWIANAVVWFANAYMCQRLGWHWRSYGCVVVSAACAVAAVAAP